MQVLVAPDAFKGSLNSVAVARALAAGWQRGRPDDVVRISPLADGGEGTLDAVAAAGGWQVLNASARDALDRPLEARFLRDELGEGRAVVELAEASGLSRLASDERDAMAASTFGTGLVLAASIGLGCRRIVLGLGGSATTDGGAGLLRALGARFLDATGRDVEPGGGGLGTLARVELGGLSPLLGEVDLTVASDVTNPLLGELGAAAVYGPQKGASPAQVARLEKNLSRYADRLEQAAGRPVRDTPGAGAAGGTTTALLAIADRFAAFSVRPGVEVVMELTGFEPSLMTSQLVLTGEGRVDAQTAHGKTALGVAVRARTAGRACICFAGGATPEGVEVLGRHGAIVVPVSEGPGTVEAAIAAGTDPLERAAERAAKLVSLAG